MQFSFPVLERKEILSCLSADAGITLEEQHLVKPSMETVWPVYESLVLNIMGITREELQQPAFHAIEKLEYPELHEESVGILASIRAISKLMAVTGVDDFSTMDIFKPESKRTITHLSAIINLLKFKQGKERDLAEVLDERERAFVLYQQSEERLAALKNEIEALEADRLAQQPAVQALEAETKVLNQEIQALNKQHGALQSDIRALKQEGQAVAEEISAEKYSLIQQKEEQERLKSQIVQSPQKLQRSLAEKKAALISTKASAEEAQQLLNSFKGKLEAYNKVEKKLKKLFGMLDEVEKLWVKQKATIKEKKAFKAQVKSIEEEIESLDTELSQLKFQEQHWLELTEKLEQQGPKKLQEAKRELEDTEANCLPVLARIEERGAANLKAEAQVKEIREKLEAMTRKKENIIARGEAAVQKVMKETLHHYRTLLEVGPAALAALPNSRLNRGLQ
ncbi:uncharacterized protein [Physcomitrium patens]|uniref:Uncharacterized protein n=1 Tax=Physcomitrium patens TaxID=3218 RepID=A0A2K1JPN4_PHYPA|nr:kinetochore protein Nuf2-like [Physcomitrium patens]PNR43502.1 hypothetical protein PHYPA_015883 [Physcomitrium patens]|eukprot:XP_024390098.1 kinetochore protein Nuf2-like [Physcomitrella patens]